MPVPTPAAAPLSMGPTEWALLLVLSTLWGGSFFFVEVALAGALPLFAVLACLGGGLSYAVAGVYGRRLKALGVGTPQAAFGQALTSALLLVPVVALLEPPWELPAPGAPALGALVALGLLSSALAYAIFFRILTAGGVINASLVTLLMPVTAILLGAAVLGERTEPHHCAGFAVIALAILLIDGRVLRWAARRPGQPAPERR